MTSPSAKTPAVCVTVTVAPSSTASPRPALRADEIAGDQRLAVARRERVCRAPEGRDQQREQDHAEREVAARDQLREAVVGDPVGRLRATTPRRAPVPARPSPAANVGGGARDVERAVQEILRIRAEASLRELDGAVVETTEPPCVRRDDDLLPADAGPE